MKIEYLKLQILLLLLLLLPLKFMTNLLPRINIVFSVKPNCQKTIEKKRKKETHQQLLSFLGLEDDEVGHDVHVDVTTVIVDVSMMTHNPDFVVCERNSF